MTRRIAMLSMHTSPLAALGGKETGGMNVYVRELSRHLGTRGWQVDVFTRLQGSAAPAVQVQEGENYRVIHIPDGAAGPVDRRELFQYLPAYIDGIRQFSANEGASYDLIHSHYWLSGWAARELRDAWGAPIVHMFHTLGRMKEAATQNTNHREAANRAQIEQEIMEYADRIVAATPMDRQQMLSLYRVNQAKISVVPCGVNLSLFHPIDQQEAREHVGALDGRRLILFVGRLDPVKGLDVLLEAMCELTRRLKPCRTQDLSLAIIGGDQESHLEAMMTDLKCLKEIREDLDLGDLVIFVGSRSQEELPYYYSAAEVCVMPSLYESFGMVALEAMACGTPVIGSRVGGLTFTIRDGETGFLVPERNPKALAEKLELVLNNPGLRRRLGQRAVEVAACYNWEIITDDMETLYAELGVQRVEARQLHY